MTAQGSATATTETAKADAGSVVATTAAAGDIESGTGVKLTFDGTEAIYRVKNGAFESNSADDVLATDGSTVTTTSATVNGTTASDSNIAYTLTNVTESDATLSVATSVKTFTTAATASALGQYTESETTFTGTATASFKLGSNEHEVTFAYTDNALTGASDGTTALTANSDGTYTLDSSVTMTLSSGAFADGTLDSSEIALTTTWNGATVSDSKSSDLTDGISVTKNDAGNVVTYKFDDTHYYRFLLDSNFAPITLDATGKTVDGIKFTNTQAVAFSTSADGTFTPVAATLSGTTFTITAKDEETTPDAVGTIATNYTKSRSELSITPGTGVFTLTGKDVANATFGTDSNGNLDGAGLSAQASFTASNYEEGNGSFSLTFTSPTYEGGVTSSAETYSFEISDITGYNASNVAISSGAAALWKGTVTVTAGTNKTEFANTDLTAWLSLSQGAVTKSSSKVTANLSTASSFGTGANFALGTSGLVYSIGTNNVWRSVTTSLSLSSGTSGTYVYTLNTSASDVYTGAILTYSVDSDDVGTIEYKTTNQLGTGVKATDQKVTWQLSSGGAINVVNAKYYDADDTANSSLNTANKISAGDAIPGTLDRYDLTTGETAWSATSTRDLSKVDTFLKGLSAIGGNETTIKIGSNASAVSESLAGVTTTLGSAATAFSAGIDSSTMTGITTYRYNVNYLAAATANSETGVGKVYNSYSDVVKTISDDDDGAALGRVVPYNLRGQYNVSGGGVAASKTNRVLQLDELATQYDEKVSVYLGTDAEGNYVPYVNVEVTTDIINHGGITGDAVGDQEVSGEKSNGAPAYRWTSFAILANKGSDEWDGSKFGTGEGVDGLSSGSKVGITCVDTGIDATSNTYIVPTFGSIGDLDTKMTMFETFKDYDYDPATGTTVITSNNYMLVDYDGIKDTGAHERTVWYQIQWGTDGNTDNKRGNYVITLGTNHYVLGLDSGTILGASTALTGVGQAEYNSLTDPSTQTTLSDSVLGNVVVDINGEKTGTKERVVVALPEYLASEKALAAMHNSSDTVVYSGLTLGGDTEKLYSVVVSDTNIVAAAYKGATDDDKDYKAVATANITADADGNYSLLKLQSGETVQLGSDKTLNPYSGEFFLDLSSYNLGDLGKIGFNLTDGKLTSIDYTDGNGTSINGTYKAYTTLGTDADVDEDGIPANNIIYLDNDLTDDVTPYTITFASGAFKTSNNVWSDVTKAVAGLTVKSSSGGATAGALAGYGTEIGNAFNNDETYTAGSVEGEVSAKAVSDETFAARVSADGNISGTLADLSVSAGSRIIEVDLGDSKFYYVTSTGGTWSKADDEGKQTYTADGNEALYDAAGVLITAGDYSKGVGISKSGNLSVSANGKAGNDLVVTYDTSKKTYTLQNEAAAQDNLKTTITFTSGEVTAVSTSVYQSAGLLGKTTATYAQLSSAASATVTDATSGKNAIIGSYLTNAYTEDEYAKLLAGSATEITYTVNDGGNYTGVIALGSDSSNANTKVATPLLTESGTAVTNLYAAFNFGTDNVFTLTGLYTDKDANTAYEGTEFSLTGTNSDTLVVGSGDDTIQYSFAASTYSEVTVTLSSDSTIKFNSTALGLEITNTEHDATAGTSRTYYLDASTTYTVKPGTTATDVTVTSLLDTDTTYTLTINANGAVDNIAVTSEAKVALTEIAAGQAMGIVFSDTTATFAVDASGNITSGTYLDTAFTPETAGSEVTTAIAGTNYTFTYEDVDKDGTVNAGDKVNIASEGTTVIATAEATINGTAVTLKATDLNTVTAIKADGTTYTSVTNLKITDTDENGALSAGDTFTWDGEAQSATAVVASEVQTGYTFAYAEGTVTITDVNGTTDTNTSEDGSLNETPYTNISTIL